MVAETSPRIHLENWNLHLPHGDLVTVGGPVEEIVVHQWGVLGGVAVLKAGCKITGDHC